MIRSKNISIIFDLDGTIIDSVEIHKSIFQDLARNAGYDLTDEEFFEKLLGQTDADTFAYISEKAGGHTSKELLMIRKLDKFRTLLRNGEVPPTKGVTEFIRCLSESGFPLGICTNSEYGEAVSSLEGIGVPRPYFDVIVGAENHRPAKPAPDPYLEVAYLLGVAPETCIVFEDSVAGVRSATSAGMFVIGIGTKKAPQLMENGAQMVIPNFENFDLNHIAEVTAV